MVKLTEARKKANKKWDEDHPAQSKEIDWGEPVGREFKW